MGLADACIKLNIKYGSEEFNKFCDKIGKILARDSLLASAAIADIKGSFELWDNVVEMLVDCSVGFNPNLDTIETYEDALILYDDAVKQMNTLLKCPEVPISLKSALQASYEDSVEEDGKMLFSLMINSIFNGKGLRNSRRLSIAPTGTIALLLNTSSSIEPNFAYEWTRTVTVGTNEKKELKYYHKLFNDDNLKAGLLISAHDLTPMQHAEVVKIFAPYIDSAISKTVNLPADATVKDVKAVYEYCYRNNIKGITIYRDGSRDEQPLKKEDKRESNIEEAKKLEVPLNVPFKQVIESSVKERPKIMHGVTTKSDSPYGSIYVTANFDETGKMFETFISAGKSGSVSKSVTEAFSRVISLALRSGVKIDDIVKTISNISGSEVWVYDTLDGQEVIVKSIPDASGRMLQDLNLYYKQLQNQMGDQKQEVITIDRAEVESHETSFGHVTPNCPECGSKMIPGAGCGVCPSCGWSSCR